MIVLLVQQLQRIGHPILGYIIPTIIFLISFIVAYRLYKHFTKQIENEK
jgi:hypothetical protein